MYQVIDRMISISDEQREMKRKQISSLLTIYEDNVVKRICTAFLFCIYRYICIYTSMFVCVCVCNRIHHVYAHFSSSAVVAHRQGKYLGPASVFQYSHCYSFHSFSSLSFSLLLLLSLCVRIVLLSQKGLLYWWVFFYYDYILLLLSPSSSPSLSLSMFFHQCHKKTESE